MRLFYQSFGVSRGSRDGAYGQLLKRIVDSAAAPGTEISVSGLSPHRAIAEQYRYLEFLDTAEVLENGRRAESEGHDAFLIGNIFDPGLHEMRELLNIPVLGLCECSVHVACLMGGDVFADQRQPEIHPSHRRKHQTAGSGLAPGLSRADEARSPGRLRSGTAQ